MSSDGGSATVFTSSTVQHPVDRSALSALELEVGEENALATCRIGSQIIAVVHDEGEVDPECRVVVRRSTSTGWHEVGRFEYWADAYRSLGLLLDAAGERVPIDRLERPSPTLVIPCGGGIEVMYRTDIGVRIARELDESYEPRVEVYDLLWQTFAQATDDEAAAGELRG